jgi:hypothetical protein
MMRPITFSAAALAVALFFAARAHAQEDPRKAQAEALFGEGLKLHDKDREAEALEKFRQAHAILPTPNSLYWVAREEQLLGRALDALQHYREALRNPLLHPKNGELSKKYIAELEPRFARLLLVGDAGTRFAIGGRDVRLPMADPIDLEAGPVALKGDRDGTPYEANGVSVAGTTVTLAVKPAAARAEADEHASRRAPPVTEPPPERSDGGVPTARWVVPVGLGAVGITGIVLGVVFLSKGNAADDEAKTLGIERGCLGVVSGPCDRAGQLRSDWKTDSTLSSVSFVAGSAFIAGGVLLAALWWPKGKATTGIASVIPLLSATHTGVLGSVRF